MKMKIVTGHHSKFQINHPLLNCLSYRIEGGRAWGSECRSRDKIEAFVELDKRHFTDPNDLIYYYCYETDNVRHNGGSCRSLVDEDALEALSTNSTIV